METFNILLYPLFFWIIVQKNQKPNFFKIRDLFLYINLKWRAKLEISLLPIRDSDWLNCIHNNLKLTFVQSLVKLIWNQKCGKNKNRFFKSQRGHLQSPEINLNTKLVWRFAKREDQALISISTILKFTAQLSFVLLKATYI